MIRFSLVIQNKKKEYLICKCPLTEQDDFSYEFLGGEIIGNIKFGWVYKIRYYFLKHSFAHVILIEINRDLVLLVIKVNLYISVAWETVECEKIVNANCKKRYKANRLKLAESRPEEKEMMISVIMNCLK